MLSNNGFSDHQPLSDAWLREQFPGNIGEELAMAMTRPTIWRRCRLDHTAEYHLGEGRAMQMLGTLRHTSS